MGAAQLGSFTDDELTELYAYPATPRPWVRANFISSLDGGATAEGRSGTLAGAGDQVVFKALRTLADVVVVGAGTVRIENYGGARLSAPQRRDRANRGQLEVPPLAIVTNSGSLERDSRVFTDTEVPPLVLTAAATADSARRALAGVAEVLDCSAADPAAVDVAVALRLLADRGLPRVLTEGGPTLLGSLIEHDLLNELCLTIAPCLVGGGAPRIAGGTSQTLTRMRRAHLLTDDAGYLYGRYIREA